MNDAAQGAVEDVPKDVAQDLGFGARAARALLATPPPPPPCLCAVRAELPTGQLSGIWLGLWAAAFGGAAQSASMFILIPFHFPRLYGAWRMTETTKPGGSSRYVSSRSGVLTY